MTKTEKPLSFAETVLILRESPQFVRRVTENGFLKPMRRNPLAYSPEEVAEYANECHRRSHRLSELIESGEALYSDDRST